MMLNVRVSRSFIYTLLLSFFCLNSLTAQTTLWEVKGKRGSLYLGGTIHILRQEDYPLPEEFVYAYDLSEVIVFEADIKELQQPETAAQILEQAFYQNGTTIEDHLTADTKNRLADALTDFGIPFDSVKQMKPGLLISTLSMLQLQGAGLESQGVDQYFYDRAVKDGKTRNFLEEPGTQIRLITEMGTGYEDAFIQYSLDDLDHTEDNILLLISDWKAGKHELMDQSIALMNERYPELYRDLLWERNHNWLPLIEGYIKSPPRELILFGALHLYGEDGILQLLERRGYKVKLLIPEEVS